MPQIPSRLSREYESPSPDHRTRYTIVVNTVLRYSNVLHLHQRVCHKVGDTMVRTSRFTIPISWMCKKHTSVSHSSTESEIIFLDTGLRLDGLFARELWDLIVSVWEASLKFETQHGDLSMLMFKEIKNLKGGSL